TVDVDTHAHRRELGYFLAAGDSLTTETPVTATAISPNVRASRTTHAARRSPAATRRRELGDDARRGPLGREASQPSPFPSFQPARRERDARAAPAPEPRAARLRVRTLLPRRAARRLAYRRPGCPSMCSPPSGSSSL